MSPQLLRPFRHSQAVCRLCLSPKEKLVSEALLFAKSPFQLCRVGECFALFLFSWMDLSIIKAQNVIYFPCGVPYGGNNLNTFFFCCLYNLLGFLRSNERQIKATTNKCHLFVCYPLLGLSALTSHQFRKIKSGCIFKIRRNPPRGSKSMGPEGHHCNVQCTVFLMEKEGCAVFSISESYANVW